MRRLPVLSLEHPIEVQIDGVAVRLSETATILDACTVAGVDIPTLCFAENLTPVNACRLCVVELEGARTLVPACSRRVEPGMKIQTSSARVTHARKLVLELLGSSVDLSTAPSLASLMVQYGADCTRFGQGAAREGRDRTQPGRHAVSDGAVAQTVAQPIKDDNDLFVRDYGKCVLCYKCVEACGTDAQNSFAIAVAGRGFDARISTEINRPLTDSACVFCGNCIGVCPTGALMFKSEHTMRAAGTWNEEVQTTADTVCPYCGVGCVLTLHQQEGKIVKVTSPVSSSVTNGHLCIKGRFGWGYVAR